MDLLLQAFNFIYNFIFGTAVDPLDYGLRTILVVLIVMGVAYNFAPNKKAASAQNADDSQQ